MTSKEIDDLINRARFGFDMEGQTAVNTLKQAITERDSLKAQLKEWYRKAQDLDAENGVLKVRLAEFVRRAREIQDPALRFRSCKELIRDLAAEKVEP